MSLPDDLANCLVLNTVAAARTLLRRGDAGFRPFGVTVQQFSLLAAIRFNPETPVAVLARRILLDRTSLTRNLDLLEQRGLVERVPDGDANARLCRLTEAGGVLLDRLLDTWKRAQTDLLAEFNETEVETYLRIAKHFAQGE